MVSYSVLVSVESWYSIPYHILRHLWYIYWYIAVVYKDFLFITANTEGTPYYDVLYSIINHFKNELIVIWMYLVYIQFSTVVL